MFIPIAEFFAIPWSCALFIKSGSIHLYPRKYTAGKETVTIASLWDYNDTDGKK